MAKEGANKSRGRDGGSHLWLVARHDFRQPTQALALLADALRHARSPEDIAMAADSIRCVAESLDGLMKGLSLVARVEAGETKPARSAVDLGRCLAEVLDGLAGLPPARYAQITAGTLGAAVAADPVLTAAALRGLLLNALGAAGRRERIEIRAVQRRAAVVLELDYTGRDLAPAFATQAIVELSPHAVGAGPTLIGLGLALSARLAEAMDGSLAATTGKDGRRRLSLALPAAAE